MIKKLLQLLKDLFDPGDRSVRPQKDYIVKRAVMPIPTLYLNLLRIWRTHKTTVGKLFHGANMECYILEDFDRLKKGGKKIHGETAIPTGTYNIKITYSPRFKRKLPFIQDVPGFKGIRIHSGNTAEDTEGCLLPGLTRGENFVGQSRRAFNKLFKKLDRAEREGKRIVLRIE